MALGSKDIPRGRSISQGRVSTLLHSPLATTLVFHLASLASWARAFACLTVPFEVGESFPMLSLVKEDDHLHSLPQGTPVSLSSHRENDTQAEFPYASR